LLKLFAVSGKPEFRDAAVRAIAYENSVFDRDRGNWPDYRRPTGAPGFVRQWCNGAPGIALGRLGCLGIDLSLDPLLSQNLEIALDTTFATSMSPLDNLCCGNLGLVEVLWTTGQVLNRFDLRARALKLASGVIQRADKQAGYRLMLLGEEWAYNPTFFRGMAGIGYQILRLIYPKRLPCILLLEGTSKK
jgi:lantibiotic modifying enzyme